MYIGLDSGMEICSSASFAHLYDLMIRTISSFFLLYFNSIPYFYLD